jgi:hypothetical protein
MDIRIGEFRFSRANAVTIRKSTSSIGATAVIKMPVSAVIENKGERTGLVEVQHTIKVGDPVSITLGYHTKDRDFEAEEFKGYVRRINPTIPLEVECEDNNFLLRKKNINKSWKSTTLKDVLKEIVSGTGISLINDLPDIALSPFYLRNTDGAFALQKLADEYGLTIYFLNDGALYAGLAYTRNAGEETLIINGDEVNVVDADDLKFRKAEDVKLKIKAISFRGDNSKIETELGDEDGTLRTLNFYNIDNMAELKEMARQEIDKYKFDGYEGSVECFLIPFIYPGYKVNLTDETFPDRAGSYFVESTKVTAGDNGIRREIEISIKL